MERNEPSTAEIVIFLGNLQTAIGSNRHSDLWHYEQILSETRSRLEQLERDLKAFKAFHERYAEQTSKKYVADICALTDRAEKAEAERDAAVNDIRILVNSDANIKCSLVCDGECLDCTSSASGIARGFKWRGLRGKENDGK